MIGVGQSFSECPPVSSPAWKIVNVALATIVIAETVHQLLVVLSYRRGWNG